MEGISKEDVMSLIYTDDYANDLIDAEEAISLCAELPAPQWQTIDEFKDSGFTGLCWIFSNRGGDVFVHNYDGKYFINPYMPNYPAHNEDIAQVMPIKTPDAPK